MEKGFIGIDLGTSAVKLLLMDEAGQIIRIVSKEYPISFPKPGWSEQSPYDWYDRTIEGLRELVDGYGDRIAGISFGGQMHGLVVLDAEDRVIRPAILWNDGRTSEECEYLNGDVGAELLARETGNIAFAGFTAPKILWMKKNEPESFARIAKIMLPKDYIAYRLSGVHATDPSDASGMLLYDVEHRCWSEKMCEICGISVDMLAKVYESYEIIGSILPEEAEKIGVSPDVKIVIGAGDNAAAAVGTGTVRNGDCNVSLGTSGTVFIATDEFFDNKNHAIHNFAHATGRYHLMGCILSAASCNKWWVEDILGATDYTAEQEGMDERLGHNHVYFLPYLMGERAPHNDPAARGAFVGMSMDTSRLDMTQAVFEGVAFALRDSLEAARAAGLDIQRTKICGGGAKSPLWRKIIANVMNVEVETIESEEGPSLGGACLAAVGCGVFPTVEAASDAVVRVTGVEKPDAALVSLYEERYSVYRKLYPALKEIYKDL